MVALAGCIESVPVEVSDVIPDSGIGFRSLYSFQGMFIAHQWLKIVSELFS